MSQPSRKKALKQKARTKKHQKTKNQMRNQGKVMMPQRQARKNNLLERELKKRQALTPLPAMHALRPQKAESSPKQ